MKKVKKLYFTYKANNLSFGDIMPDREFRASDLTRKSGEILHAATIAPITLTNHGKPRHVILSVEAFERLKEAGNTQQAFKMEDLPEDLHAELMIGVDRQLDDDQ